jgi:hypothetical protein
MAQRGFRLRSTTPSTVCRTNASFALRAVLVLLAGECGMWRYPGTQGTAVRRVTPTEVLLYLLGMCSVGLWRALPTCCEKLAETRQDAESRGTL